MIEKWEKVLTEEIEEYEYEVVTYQKTQTKFTKIVQQLVTEKKKQEEQKSVLNAIRIKKGKELEQKLKEQEQREKIARELEVKKHQKEIEDYKERVRKLREIETKWKIAIKNAKTAEAIKFAKTQFHNAHTTVKTVVHTHKVQEIRYIKIIKQ